MSNSQDGSNIFKEEASELLENLEAELLELESSPDNREIMDTVFRTMHTVKGSGAMFGFEAISSFTHEIETVFDQVRAGKIKVTAPLIELSLKARDHILKLLDAHPAGNDEVNAVSRQMISDFRLFNPAANIESSSETKAIFSPKQDRNSKQETFWIRFVPDLKIMDNGTRPLALIEELATMGMSKIIFNPQSIPLLNNYVPEEVYGSWDIFLCSDEGIDAVLDVFIFVDEPSKVHVFKIGDQKVRAADLNIFKDFIKKNTDLPVEATAQALTDLLAKTIEPRSQKNISNPVDQKPTDRQSQSLRVDAQRLDKIVNMVGELVIIQSRLAQAASKAKDSGIISQISEDLERLTDEMRDNTLGLRMLPIGSVFNAMRRLVRDLASQLGRKINLITQGAEAELDKTMIDSLKDPLMHILRNSIDHGIEPPQKRLECGKKEEGTITLRAEHASGEIVIHISDDGAGIDPAVIKAKAVEKGMIEPGAELNRQEMLALIFAPGFSTSTQISDVSGRGVGMDVVRRNIESLRGRVDIDSELGIGTHIAIRLPLTLSIIDGLNVVVEGESYIIPLETVEACEERFISNQQVRDIEIISRRGNMVPCVSLRKILDVQGVQPKYERIIICRHSNTEVGFAVDGVIGRQQAVIKRLSDYYRNLRWISGTTINGDGKISLILDVAQLVGFAKSINAQEMSKL